MAVPPSFGWLPAWASGVSRREFSARGEIKISHLKALRVVSDCSGMHRNLSEPAGPFSLKNRY